jgi:hypothetical protein
MQILFTISALCFMVLVWAMVSVTRHIHTGQKRNRVSAAPQTSFAQHLFAATQEDLQRSPRHIPQQTIKEVTAKKNWNSPAAALMIQPSNDHAALSFSQRRPKAPQLVTYDAAQRLDWEYFNKDAGDLSDPYQARGHRANAGAHATSPKRP